MKISLKEVVANLSRGDMFCDLKIYTRTEEGRKEIKLIDIHKNNSYDKYKVDEVRMNDMDMCYEVYVTKVEE